jgi:outer membrane protein
MKKTLSTLLVSFSLATVSTFSFAEDLATVYQQALASDPAVLKAQAQFEASKESIEQARSVLLPQIYGSAAYSRSYRDSQQVNDDFSTFDVNSETRFTSLSANLSMQIYHHDTWQRMDNAKKAAHLSDVAYQIAKQQLIVRVTQAYFAVLSAKDDLEFSRAEKKAIERQLEQTKQRFAVGLTAITDVHEAQAKFDKALTDEIVAQNNVYFREEELRSITNVYPGELSTLDTSTFSTTLPTPNSADAWQKVAEEKSLDIIAQKINTDIAKENINIAQSGHLPTVDLTGSYGQSKSKSLYNVAGYPEIETSTPFFDNKSIGISVTVPIYSGGATSSKVRQAQHNYVATSQDLALAYRSVVRNARTAYNTVIASVSAIKSLEQSVISAESALKATEAGFEVGTRTIVDVLNSTQNLYNAKRNLSSTRYGYIQSVLALKRAGGTISEQDIADINKGLTAAKQ